LGAGSAAMGGGAQTTMSADVSLVLVAYRSSAVAADAVMSFRRECSRLGLTSEVVIVDHSEDPGEAGRLHCLAPEKLLVLPNRGYAAGINTGVAASVGVTVVAGNPDVEFGDGSLAALLEALRSGWHIVGPQFGLAGFLFPPADLQTPAEDISRWLAGRSRAVWRRYLRRELRCCRQVWEATAPVAQRALSGALLAFRRETFNGVGTWDEGFFLYFEETDWLRRAMASGLRIALVPGARVEHRWAHAADPEVFGGQYLASRARFMATHHRWTGRLVSHLRQRGLPLTVKRLPRDPGRLPEGEHWWLLSPTALGIPAAGLLGTATELGEALNGIAAARGPRGIYIVVAAEPESCDVVGAWSWEASGG
jgi:GT2 family glycosyltransferase